MPALPVPPMLKLFSLGVSFGGFWTPEEDQAPSGLAPGFRFGAVIPDSPLEVELALSFSQGVLRGGPYAEKLSFNHADLLTTLVDGYTTDLLVGGGVGWRHLNIEEASRNGLTAADALGYEVNPAFDLFLSVGPSFRQQLWGPLHLRADVHASLSIGGEPASEGTHVLPGVDGSLAVDLRYEPPPDRDRDGVSDRDDRCPGTLEDLDLFDDFDGCLDPDDDHDTIPDFQDQCRTQAEDVDGFKDDDGCDDHNNDRDAYPDAGDRCPNEAETENAWLDGDGCPDTMPADLAVTLSRGRELRFHDAALDPSSEAALLEVVTRLNQYAEAMVTVAVHTDGAHGATAARELTMAQAKTLYAWFEAHGAPMLRLDFVWKGDSLPLNPDQTDADHEANRRVDLILTDNVGSDGKPVDFSPKPPGMWR